VQVTKGGYIMSAYYIYSGNETEEQFYKKAIKLGFEVKTNKSNHKYITDGKICTFLSSDSRVRGAWTYCGNHDAEYDICRI